MRQYTKGCQFRYDCSCLVTSMRGWEARPNRTYGEHPYHDTCRYCCWLWRIGKHGSIINPEFGSSFRLSAILTDAPLPISKPKSHGVDDFCSACRVCEDACPPFAILPEKKTVRGIKKWYVDFDKCLPFFNQHQGCGICIAVCPWSRPGVGLNLQKNLNEKEIE